MPTKAPNLTCKHKQFDKSNNSALRDFSCENDNSSWTENNINVYESNNVTVQRGLIDGNNSPTGDGVMFECGDRAHAYMTAGSVLDVDAINQVYRRVCLFVCLFVVLLL